MSNKVKEIKTKKRAYENFDPNNIKIDEKSYENNFI